MKRLGYARRLAGRVLHHGAAAPSAIGLRHDVFSLTLLDEIEAYLPPEPPTGVATQPVVSLDLRTRLGDVRLFTIIATLGAPLEVTAANLAIETFLPADEESAARLRDLANAGTTGAKVDHRTT